jgi:uncharacterized protein
MTNSAQKSWNPRRFDVRAFAEAGASWSASDSLGAFERLAGELQDDGNVSPNVHWSVRGETRPDPAGQPAVWLHVQAALALPLSCQRCLKPVAVPLEVNRWFRFVADEATAEAEDDDTEEDVLALEPRPDLLALIEDELLMEMPLVPMHEACPEPLPAPDAREAAADPKETRVNPFASLARLKR